MAITLVTGLPGHGKTLYALQWVRDLAAREGRPVFYSGIRDLKLPWQEFKPEDWRELEPGAIFVIDECQACFPVRGRGQPPEWIEELAKHRHRGIDFVVITQNPMLMDSFVRRLVDRQFHLVRKFGTHFATVHEYPNGVKENVAASREGSIRHEWRYPKDVFELYKSAELHTVKRRVPARLWLLLAAPLVVLGCVWALWRNFKEKTEAPPAPEAAASAPAGSPAAPKLGSGPGAGPALDLVAAHHPRVPGLAYTAPVYDTVTAPTQAPYPAACVATQARCQCYTQQGTRLDMPEQLCRDIAERGFFVAWQAPAAQAVPVKAVALKD